MEKEKRKKIYLFFFFSLYVSHLYALLFLEVMIFWAGLPMSYKLRFSYTTGYVTISVFPLVITCFNQVVCIYIYILVGRGKGAERLLVFRIVQFFSFFFFFLCHAVYANFNRSGLWTNSTKEINPLHQWNSLV